MTKKKKLIRITTVPGSLGGLLSGQLKFMNNYFKVIGISSFGNGLLEKVANQEQIETISIEMTRKITPLNDLVALFKLYKTLKKEKPFIVHTHTPKAGTLGMLAAKLAGVSHRLHTIAGLPLLEVKGNKRILLNLVEKLTYACATKIYPNSYGLQKIILENKFTKKTKVKVLGNGSSNGIDTSYFNPNYDNISKDKLELRANLKIEQKDFVFLFVGRLVGDKGINELINVFDKLCNIYPDIKLLLVGPYESELDPLKSKTLKGINNNPCIITTGWVNDVRPYYAISDALTFPSYREGFPNVVMQAASMQLPCIVSNINGCNEIIKHMENGIIVPVKNELALFNAMEYNITNKEEVKTMGLKSRELMTSYFERKVVWQAILEEYNQLK